MNKSQPPRVGRVTLHGEGPLLLLGRDMVRGAAASWVGECGRFRTGMPPPRHWHHSPLHRAAAAHVVTRLHSRDPCPPACRPALASRSRALGGGGPCSRPPAPRELRAPGPSSRDPGPVSSGGGPSRPSARASSGQVMLRRHPVPLLSTGKLLLSPRHGYRCGSCRQRRGRDRVFGRTPLQLL